MATRARRKRPVDGDTVFEIASVTKVFTTLLLADIAQRGEVALGDPLAAYLPANVRVPQRRGRQITLVDLATHTSGLPPQPPDLPGLDDPAAATYSAEQLYSSLCMYQLTRDIGSEWEYGNLDIALLGHALARRAGTDYESLVRARLTGPLGLRRTSTVEASFASNLAVSHDSDLRPTGRLALGALTPAGAMFSSVNDLLTLLGVCLGIVPSPLAAAVQAMVATRRPMRPPMLAMLRRHWRTILRMALSPRRRGGRQSPVFSRAEQALGWYIVGRDREEIVVHDGAGPGGAASIAYDAKSRAGVVVLSNTGITVQDISRHVLWRESPLARPRREVTLDPTLLDCYVGHIRPRRVLHSASSETEIACTCACRTCRRCRSGRRASTTSTYPSCSSSSSSTGMRKAASRRCCSGPGAVSRCCRSGSDSATFLSSEIASTNYWTRNRPTFPPLQCSSPAGADCAQILPGPGSGRSLSHRLINSDSPMTMSPR